jgi:farnesyl-diphosphate farnesyltransferase
MIVSGQDLNLDDLLRTHARSFALTLRFLPKNLRDSLSLGYLLARASDTVADAKGIALARRLEMLGKLQDALERGEALNWTAEIKQGEISESESELISALPMLLGLLEASSAREELLNLWKAILTGQLFDLHRFSDKAQPLSRVELEEYCYLVAGSVGEAWTRLIAIHSPDILLRPMEEMTKLGISYGKGLQLLNILRDRAEDRKLGRIYVVESDVPAMMDQTSAWLGEGKDYGKALAPGRIRYATALPLLLAEKTLDLMKKRSSALPVKISRAKVYCVLLQALPSLVLRSSRNPDS